MERVFRCDSGPCNVCRLTAQFVVQPGLGKVYSQILLQSHTSAEFYLKVISSFELCLGDVSMYRVALSNAGPPVPSLTPCPAPSPSSSLLHPSPRPCIFVALE